jgi:hypothetical protein
MLRIGRWGKPFRSKVVAPLYFGGGILAGIVAPLALLSGKETRGKSLLASTLVLLGGLAYRFSIIEAGKKSAEDPEAYFTFAKKENAPEPGDKI